MKPYVKRNKTDAADAEAICEAVARPNMRFVPIKTVEQQGILALHRVRSLLVRQRTAAVNAARGLLAEFDVVADRGIQRIDELRRRMDHLDAELFPDEARTALNGLFAHIDTLYEQVATIDARGLSPFARS